MSGSPQTELSFPFQTTVWVWRCGCRSTAPVHCCLCLKSIQTFCPSSAIHILQSSLASIQQANTIVPSLLPPPPHPSLRLLLFEPHNYNWEIEFDMALKGTAAWHQLPWQLFKPHESKLKCIIIINLKWRLFFFSSSFFFFSKVTSHLKHYYH